MARTPTRPSRHQREPASAEQLDGLLEELDIQLPRGQIEYELVSEWAAKHVWSVLANGKPWAFIRYLLGPASSREDRWRHMRLGVDLAQAHVGPRMLGISEESMALGGRAVVVEAALEPLEKEELIARAEEAIVLFGRLHSYIPLHSALSRSLTEADLTGLRPLVALFSETRERWFEAVVERWLGVGLTEISELADVVGVLFNAAESIRRDDSKLDIVVPAHNDPNYGNFMLNRKGAMRMIDFEGLALSHPVADLGMFLSYYVPREQHFDLLKSYPLSDADVLVEKMRVWVPLKYLGVAAHWAARLTKSTEQEAWGFAVESIDEWLRGAAEMLFDGRVPQQIDSSLNHIFDSLLERWPPEDENE